MNQTNNWAKAWQPIVLQVGRYCVSEGIVWSLDAVEAGAVRRWMEPLEFDCLLHTDTAVAQAHGYAERVAPSTALSTFTVAPLRQPGSVLFTSAERNAQPLVKGLRPPLPPGAPAVSGYFATDMEWDFLRPVCVGERLGRRGPTLVSCVPKETRIGRGAFITFESELWSDTGDLVARMRYCIYCYNPLPNSPAEPCEETAS